MYIIVLVLFLTSVHCATPPVSQQLCSLVNDLRGENSLTPLVHSEFMRYIAEGHLINLINNEYDPFTPNICNPHSWFKNDTLNIDDCCYPLQNCMGVSGRNISRYWQTQYLGITLENIYASKGFIFFGDVDPVQPETVVTKWTMSSGHLATMLSENVICGGSIIDYRQGNAVITLAALWVGSIGDDGIVIPVTVPTRRPTAQPTKMPTRRPTQRPSRQPTVSPTTAPVARPTRLPTKSPIVAPVARPTGRPTRSPTATPVNRPTQFPTKSPSETPTKSPTNLPTQFPTVQPQPQCQCQCDDCYSYGNIVSTAISFTTIGILVTLLVRYLFRWYIKQKQIKNEIKDKELQILSRNNEKRSVRSKKRRLVIEERS